MRVIPYPENSGFDSAFADQDEFWIATVPKTAGVTSSRNPRRFFVTVDWISDLVIPPEFNWRSRTTGGYRLVRTADGAIGAVPFLREYPDSIANRVVEFRTGRTRLLTGGETALIGRTCKAVVYDDNWVVMTADVVHNQGEFLLGPTLFKSCCAHVASDWVRRSGLLFIYRRGGDVRTFDLRKTIGTIVGVYLFPDACTVLVVGYKAAVLLDLE